MPITSGHNVMLVQYRVSALFIAMLFATLSAMAEEELTKTDVPATMPEPVRSLVLQTFSTNPVERAEAASELAKLRERAEPALPFLIRLLEDTASVPGEYKRTVGKEAAFAIDKLGKRKVEPCIAALRQSSGVKKEMLIKILCGSDDPRAAEAIASFLSSKDAKTRHLAATSLSSGKGVGESKNIFPLLIAALNDNDVPTRREIAAILGEIR